MDDDGVSDSSSMLSVSPAASARAAASWWTAALCMQSDIDRLGTAAGAAVALNPNS